MMPTRTFTYAAGGTLRLLELIVEDDNLYQVLRYSAVKDSGGKKRRRDLIVKLLNLVSAGDSWDLLRDLITPLDIAYELEPSRTVMEIDL